MYTCLQQQTLYVDCFQPMTFLSATIRELKQLKGCSLLPVELSIVLVVRFVQEINTSVAGLLLTSTSCQQWVKGQN